MSGAALQTAPLCELTANPLALLALRESTRSLNDVLRLDVVAGIAFRLVVVHRLLRMPRSFLSHLSPPFPMDRRGAYIGMAGGAA